MSLTNDCRPAPKNAKTSTKRPLDLLDQRGLLYPDVLSEILRSKEPADWEPAESPLKGAETTLPGQALPLNAYYQGADWPGKVVDADPPKSARKPAVPPAPASFARRSKRLQQAADYVKSTNQG